MSLVDKQMFGNQETVDLKYLDKSKPLFLYVKLKFK